MNAQEVSFKPIVDLGLDPSSSCNSDSFLQGEEPISPTNIFRDATEMIQNDPMSVSPLQLANPVYEKSAGSDNNDSLSIDALLSSSHNSRVISPYPFFRPSQRELQERDELACSAWSMPEGTIDASETMEQGERPIDYSLFFPCAPTAAGPAVGMECDDFSISSHEAESIEDDLCFEKIAGDSFWDEGIDNRPRLVSQVSLSSNDSSAATAARMRSVGMGKVPRRRPA